MSEFKYSIGIVTHSKREEVFTKMIKDIRSQTDANIYVAINGDYKKTFNEEYRVRLMNLFFSYKNIYPSFYLQFRGLGKLWNDIVINSGYDDCIVTNDDITFLPGFFNDFIEAWLSSNREILKVGNSSNIPPNIGPAWSTFFVNRRFLDSCGYFNEEFLGIGAEDSEFVKRNGDFGSFITDKYLNLAGQKKFTEDLTSEGASCFSKYHQFNFKLLEIRKCSTETNFRPYEKFFLENYDTFWTNK